VAEMKCNGSRSIATFKDNFVTLVARTSRDSPLLDPLKALFAVTETALARFPQFRLPNSLKARSMRCSLPMRRVRSPLPPRNRDYLTASRRGKNASTCALSAKGPLSSPRRHVSGLRQMARKVLRQIICKVTRTAYQESGLNET
jgi:hypothetical protein